MKTFRVGFTVIEVVLALAITGLLIAAAAASTQRSITTQRYNDSIESLKDFFQSQYNQAGYAEGQVRIANDSKCKKQIAGGSIDQSLRGRSGCVMVGRLLKIDHPDTTGNTEIRAYTVFGQECDPSDFVTGATGSADTQCLQSMNLQALEPETEPLVTYTPEWDAEIYDPVSGPPRNFIGASGNSHYILIAKSPLSGSLKTYSADTLAGNFSDILNNFALINDDNIRDFTFCVAPRDDASPLRAIQINKGAANASGVEVMPVDAQYDGIDGRKVAPVVCR